MNKQFSLESTKVMAAAAAFVQSNRTSFLPVALTTANKNGSEKKAA